MKTHGGDEMNQQYNYEKYYYSIMNKNIDDNYESIIEYYYNLIKGILPEDKNAKILDVGCGKGYLLMTLKHFGYQNIQGIDIDKGQIEGCKALSLPGIYVPDTITFLADHDEEYDLVFLCDVLEHIRKDDTITFAQSIQKTIKKDGLLFCKVPNANNIIASRYRYNDWTHHTSFTEVSLAFVLYNAGFKEVNVIDEPYCVSKSNIIKSTTFLACKKLYRLLLRIVYNMELGAEGRRIPLNLNIIAIAKK